MEFDKKHRPELCAAKEDTRYQIAAVRLETTGEHSPCLVATDGRRLTVIPVTTGDDNDDADADGLIPVEAFPAARKGRKADPARIIANGDVRVLNRGSVTSYDRPDADCGTFPNWRQVIPARAPARFRVAFTSELLIGLLKALGSEHVELEFAPHGDGDGINSDVPIRVNAVGDDSFGVIMPVSGV